MVVVRMMVVMVEGCWDGVRGGGERGGSGFLSMFFNIQHQLV